MTRKLALVAGIAALAAAAPALAQPQPAQSPNRMAPPGTVGAGGTGTTSTTAANDAAQRLSTSEFLEKAAMSDRFEIGASRLALERAQDRQVKQFAQEMVRDHTRTTDQRMELMQRLRSAQTSERGTGPGGATGSGATRDSAAGSGTAPGAATGGDMTRAAGGVQPEGLDAQHRQMLAELQPAQGAEFDRLYMRQQVQAHRQAVQIFETYAQHGENAQLRQWARRTVPSLQEHLQMAQRIQGQLGQ